MKCDNLGARQQSKKVGKDQGSLQLSTSPDPGYHMGKRTTHNLCFCRFHMWYPCQINTTNKSQEVTPFPAGGYKAAMNRRESMTNTRQNNKTNMSGRQGANIKFLASLQPIRISSILIIFCFSVTFNIGTGAACKIWVVIKTRNRTRNGTGNTATGKH